MKFLIITHVIHKQKDSQFYGYAPYVREMNLWLKYVDEVEIVAPLEEAQTTALDLDYKHKTIKFNKIPSFQFTSMKHAFASLFKIPVILFAIFKACKRADHIHLRCPGNVGLLGCLVQICFPKKVKTAKYAGNWDPKSKQPLSYRLQKRILSNTFLTKNMNVLVYGKWQNQSKNIKPFFTATFHESEKEAWNQRNYTNTLQFVFVGSLVKGKQPLFAIKLMEELLSKGVNVQLDLFGDGVLRSELEMYILEKKLSDSVKLHGNVDKDEIKKVLKQAHFSLLPSLSEGWPKALAEAMFYGVIPISTKVSCVPWMLDEGRRGILIDNNQQKAIDKIIEVIETGNLPALSFASQQWSEYYTLDLFEQEIKRLLSN